jgi:hypothetical protein
MFVTSPELDTLLIHVSDVFRGEIGECVIDALQKLIEKVDVHGIEVLSALRVKIPQLRCTDLRMALLEPVDPFQTWDNATNVKYKQMDVVFVKQHCDSGLVVNLIHQCCFL